jgi:uncharacterized protein (DUF305 family)
MQHARQSSILLLVTTALLTGGVHARAAIQQDPPPIIRPGAPGEPSRIIDRKTAESIHAPLHTPADVAFMQGMIGHHAQAIEMVELLKTRTESDDMRKLAERIEVSQSDEIRMMREWLEARGAKVPDEHAHHAPEHRMPGMLTPEEMAKLAAAKGREFDRLFLEFMIKHHEGALVMVRELFATRGAGQESEIYTFASDVEADQRMEIARMAAMLKELEK